MNLMSQNPLIVCSARYRWRIPKITMKRLISFVAFTTFAIAGCTSNTKSEPIKGESNTMLTADQCNFFGVNGKVQICHQTDSATNSFSIIQVSDNACINEHATHTGDFVTSTDPSSTLFDPTCQGLGCLAQGAPCDAILPCCDGLTCTNGTCTVPCTLTDLELLDLPNGWISSGTCGQFKLFVFDQSNTLLNPGVGTGLNVSLAPGTYTFNLRGDGFDNNGGSGPDASLNIFSSCGNATGLVQGSSVTLGPSTITVTSFTASRDGDSVSPCDESPNDQADIVGNVTLQVTSP